MRLLKSGVADAPGEASFLKTLVSMALRQTGLLPNVAGLLQANQAMVIVRSVRRGHPMFLSFLVFVAVRHRRIRGRHTFAKLTRQIAEAMCHRPGSNHSRWWVIAFGAGGLVSAAGCQQGANTAVAPMTTLPGPAAAATGPNLSGLNPFGSGVRVPPPATGSYGVAGVTPSGISGTGSPGYAPTQLPASGVAPMGFTQDQWSGTTPTGSGIAPIGSTVTSVDAGLTDFSPAAPRFDPGSNSGAPVSPYRGGMPVIDLTRSPAPPGYVGRTHPTNPTGTGLGQPGFSGIGSSALPGQLPATPLTTNPTSVGPTNSPIRSGWQAAPAGTFKAF
ncbi:MAG: hypothetical protein AAF670_06720 [Planctomycetota bacterium]